MGCDHGDSFTSEALRVRLSYHDWRHGCDAWHIRLRLRTVIGECTLQHLKRKRIDLVEQAAARCIGQSIPKVEEMLLSECAKTGGSGAPPFFE